LKESPFVAGMADIYPTNYSVEEIYFENEET
jgi:hypothetical protein